MTFKSLDCCQLAPLPQATCQNAGQRWIYLIRIGLYSCRAETPVYTMQMRATHLTLLSNSRGSKGSQEENKNSKWTAARTAKAEDRKKVIITDSDLYKSTAERKHQLSRELRSYKMSLSWKLFPTKQPSRKPLLLQDSQLIRTQPSKMNAAQRKPPAWDFW